MAQGTIVSVIPSSAYAGQEQDIIIRGMGTSFSSQSTLLRIGNGSDVTVTSLKVTNSESLVAHVKVSSVAAPGPRDVTVTSGSEVATMPGGFTVFLAGNDFRATLEIIPVQKLRVADFDPNNLNNAPLLFTVRVYNDAVDRNVRAVITIIGDKYGTIGKATKKFHLDPNGYTAFDNRQFDDYDLSSAGSEVLELALQQGTLPADIYTYKLQVFSGNSNTVLATADAQNLITNPLTKPELISPGGPFTDAPTSILEKQPLFQWFSQGNSFDFYLYKVQPNQTSAEEVTLARPLYVQKGLTQNSLVYPASAYVLRDDEVYAWRIVANYSGYNGNETLPSEVYWFKLKTGSKVDNSVAEMKVTPDEAYVPVEGSAQFSVKAFNVNSEEVSIKPMWKVIPSDGGSIDENGNFKAGNVSKAVAVVATYGDLQDYVMVKVVSPPAEDLLMNNFLKKLFGVSSN